MKSVKLIKKDEDDKTADDERRLELRYLRYLKRKYPDEDKKISAENDDSGEK